MQSLKSIFLLLVCHLFVLSACNEDREIVLPLDAVDNEEALALWLNLPDTPFNYASPNLPNYFNNQNIQTTDNTPGNNTITDEGATLGRVLFYDKRLSANNTISCSSCHLQENSFTDPNTFSKGFEGGLTGRNSMSLANARYYENGKFFWDERAITLEEQALMPIQDHIEMGMSLDILVPKLQQEAYYKILFERAFGDEEVSSNRIALALSQFVRSMVSFQAKYDIGRSMLPGPPNPNANFPNFSEIENLGRQIFLDPTQGGCAGCHRTDLFIGEEALNNGLDLVYEDNGLGDISGAVTDNGKFKVPSLRNVALTGPYMHDGRFQTLEEVIEHYDNGVEAHPNLDNRLRVRGMMNRPKRLNLNQEEKEALVAFLNTLTDFNFINDEKFSDPFKQ